MNHPDTNSVRPYAFIRLPFGVVSMLMDVVYQERARGAKGRFLASLGGKRARYRLVSGLREARHSAGACSPVRSRTVRALLGASRSAGTPRPRFAVPTMGFVGGLVGVSALVIVGASGKSLRLPRATR